MFYSFWLAFPSTKRCQRKIIGMGKDCTHGLCIKGLNWLALQKIQALLGVHLPQFIYQWYQIFKDGSAHTEMPSLFSWGWMLSFLGYKPTRLHFVILEIWHKISKFSEFCLSMVFGGVVLYQRCFLLYFSALLQ